jgi:hypothetical protein
VIVFDAFLGCLFHTKFRQCRGGRWENVSESVSSGRMETRSCLRDLEDERLGFKLMGGGSFLRQSSPSAERLRNDWFVRGIMFSSRLHLAHEDQIRKLVALHGCRRAVLNGKSEVGSWKLDSAGTYTH